MKTNFEVYEDNGGQLRLYILDSKGKAIAGFGKYEFCPGSLREAIEELETNADAYKLFSNDFGGDIDMPHRYELDEDGRFSDCGEMDVDDLYREDRAGLDRDADAFELIAWVEDSKVHYCETERMGFAARAALGIKDEDEDEDDIIRQGLAAPANLTEAEIEARGGFELLDGVVQFWEPGYDYGSPDFWAGREDLTADFIRAVRSYDRLHRDG